MSSHLLCSVGLSAFLFSAALCSAAHAAPDTAASLREAMARIALLEKENERLRSILLSEDGKDVVPDPSAPRPGRKPPGNAFEDKRDIPEEKVKEEKEKKEAAEPLQMAVAEPPAEPLPASPAGPEDFIIRPHVDGYVKWGSSRTLSGAEAWVPLSWNGRTLSFMDARFVADDNEGREGNFGLGLRIVPEGAESIWGAYGFYDRRRSETGNIFSQATFGGEYLTENWDVRANGYLALSGKEKSTNTSYTTNFTFSGTGIVAQQVATTSQAVETPLSGLDLELGYKLPFLKDSWFEDTRVYGGAYHFGAAGVESMDGYRFRARARPFEWLELGLEHQSDTIRGTTNLAEVRFRIPFGRASESRKPRGIYKRLDERVIRDVDVVTQAGTQTSAVSRQAAVTNTTTGVAQKIYTVDNTAPGGGDGSTGNPFNTLAAAEAAAGAHDIVYVKAGDGTSANMDAGITLDDDGQKLIGSGAALVFDTASMGVTGLTVAPANGLVIASAGTAPVITNSAVNGDGITVTASDVEIAGLTVDSTTRYGIVANGADNLTVSDVTVERSGSHGFYAYATAAGATVDNLNLRNVTLSRSNSYGGYLLAQNGGEINNSVMDNVTITRSASTGLYAYAVGAGALISAPSFTNITASENRSVGLQLYTNTSGQITAPVLNGITADDNGSYGLYVYVLNAGSLVSDARFDNISTAQNNSQGTYLYAQNGGQIIDPVLNSFMALDNGNNGVYLNAGGAGAQIANPFLTDITARENSFDGVTLASSGGGVITAPVLDAITVEGNGQRGVATSASGAGSSMNDLMLANVTATDNGSQGVVLSISGGAQMTSPVLEDLTIADSASHGLYLYTQDAGSLLSDLSVQNSTSNGNAGSAIHLYTQNGSQITAPVLSGLTAEGNSGQGLYLRANAAGSLVSDLSLTDSTFSSNGYGVYFETVNGSQVTAPVLSGLTIQNNNSHGFYGYINNAGSLLSGLSLTDTDFVENRNYGAALNAANGGQIDTPVLSDLTMQGNRSGGVSVSAGGAGSLVNNLSLTNVEIEEGSNGVYFYTANGQIDTPVLSGLTMRDLNTHGLYVYTQGAGALVNDLSATNIDIDNSGQHGVYFYVRGGSQITTPVLDTVTSNNNGDHGLLVQTVDAGSLVSDLSVTGLTANDNGEMGAGLVVSSGGQMTDLTLDTLIARGNNFSGLYVISQNAGGSALTNAMLRNVTAEDNLEEGIYLNASSDADLTLRLEDSTATDNVLRGVYVNDDTTGTFTADLGGGALGGLGGNRFFDNQSYDLYGDLDNLQLDAESNWWGQAGGPLAGDVSMEGASTLNSSSPLAVDPGP